MKTVFVVSDHILSPLGSGTAANFEQLAGNRSGIRKHENAGLGAGAHYASLFNGDELFFPDITEKYTRFEQLLITSIGEALQQSGMDAADKKTVFILSSTKGNISLLETEPFSEALKYRIALHHSAGLIADHFRFANPPVIVSHACISGLLAMITAMRMLRSGQYENAIVAGADLITRFVFSGFQSFMAISPQPCRPFDADRNGITLGEAAGTIILSSNKKYASASPVSISSGAVSNDANHISGPSRTGEELCQAIQRAMQDADIKTGDIDFISAHGTATAYNDEMEANAFTMAGLQCVPVNSLKGYYGHTLGAAGLIESIISIESMKRNTILPTLGFQKPGTSKPLNICHSLQSAELKKCLKTASGFGGCNAAVVISRET